MDFGKLQPILEFLVGRVWIYQQFWLYLMTCRSLIALGCFSLLINAVPNPNPLLFKSFWFFLIPVTILNNALFLFGWTNHQTMTSILDNDTKTQKHAIDQIRVEIWMYCAVFKAFSISEHKCIRFRYSSSALKETSEFLNFDSKIIWPCHRGHKANTRGL